MRNHSHLPEQNQTLRHLGVYMPDFTINPSFGAPVGDISVNAAAPVPAPAATPSEPPKSTGDPDLAPGQKRPEGAQKSIYGEIPQIPVLDAVEGIKFDFNHGIRILFPHNGKTYHVTFMDIDTGVVLYSNDTVPGAFVTSVKKFYIKFRLIIHEKGNDTPIFQHDMDLRDKEVMVSCPSARSATASAGSVMWSASRRSTTASWSAS